MDIDKQKLWLLVKTFQEGNATDNEIKILVSFYEYCQKNNSWPKEIPNKELLLDDLLLNIKSNISKDNVKKGKLRKLNFRSFMKYAAAIIMLVATGYYLLINNQQIKQSEIVVIDNDIPIGNNKATLTLQDGSKVALEKGKEYSVNNVSSDGEKIIYNEQKEQQEKEAVKPTIAYNYLTIPRGGQFFIELEDDTKVWLNSESKIKYPVAFLDGQIREVELIYGEAYFDVSSSDNHNGDKFRVISKGHQIEVIGTEFNVKAYNDEEIISTTLVEGKVKIELDEIVKELLPSQQSNYNKLDGKISLRHVDVSKEIAWKYGGFNFEDSSLEDIMKVLTRWYDVEFIIENEALQNLKFNGTLGRNQNIEIVLLTLKNTNNISYEIIEKTIIIK